MVRRDEDREKRYDVQDRDRVLLQCCMLTVSETRNRLTALRRENRFRDGDGAENTKPDQTAGRRIILETERISHHRRTAMTMARTTARTTTGTGRDGHTGDV